MATMDRKHRHGFDSHAPLRPEVASGRCSLHNARRDEIVLDGMTAAEARPCGWGTLVQGVPPGMRHIGCMWYEGGYENGRCNHKAAWTMGGQTPWPRVYCQLHGRKLNFILLERKRTQRESKARIAAGLGTPRRILSTAERAHVVAVLKRARKPMIWTLAEEMNCAPCTISRIARDAGIGGKERVVALRAELVAGPIDLADLIRRYRVCLSTIKYHAGVCGLRVVIGRKGGLDLMVPMFENGSEIDSPDGVPAPPGSDATQEGS